MKKILCALILVCFFSLSYAQQERTLKFNEETNLIEVTYYHDNGLISQIGTYTTDGKLHGEWLSYCDQGNKLVAAKYDNGNKVGKWFYWNGKNLTEVDYSQNAIASVNQWTSKDALAENE